MRLNEILAFIDGRDESRTYGDDAYCPSHPARRASIHQNAFPFW